MALMGMLGTSEAQFDAKKCLTYLDCPSTLCCGTATPQISKYGDVHKICYRPQSTLYMNYNGYKFDFACDPIITDEEKEPEDKGQEKYNASKDKYESRFWDNYKATDTENIVGFGVNKPWIPPIANPESLLTIYDRFVLTSETMGNPLFITLDTWIKGYGPGDSWDGYFYNNAKASGSQLYPTGLSKYFDLYSIDGLISYTFHWIWDYIQHLALAYTLFVPIDVWLALLSGKSLDGLWKIFLFYEPFVYLSAGIPSAVAHFFNIEMEDGWGILDN